MNQIIDIHVKTYNSEQGYKKIPSQNLDDALQSL